MSNNLPPLPPGLFPSGMGPYYRASVVEQLRRDAYQQALEQVMQMLLVEHEHSRHLHNYAIVYANKVRALMEDLVD